MSDRVKGVSLNPLTQNDPYVVAQAKALNLNYNDDFANNHPDNAIAALLIEASNIFKETYGGVEAQTAPIIAQLNAQSGNAYVTKEYVEKYGLSYEQYERFWAMVNTFTSSVTDVSEPMVKIKSDFFEDCLSGATDRSSEIIQESINLYVKTENVDMSDGGKLMSCLIGIIQGFLVTGALDKSQVRHVLSDVSSSLEHI